MIDGTGMTEDVGSGQMIMSRGCFVLHVMAGKLEDIAR
jgi:hypothetical protein